MLLNTSWIGRTKYAEKLVIGNKEEARECIALGVKIIGETLLAPIQILKQVVQLIQPIVLRACFKN